MVITGGTIAVTNGSKTVTGTGTLFLTNAVKAGWLLKIGTEPSHRPIEVNATSETSLTLLEEYGGPTQTGLSYEIVKDFYDYDIPVLSPDMAETSYTVNYAHQRIIDALNNYGASSTKKQNLTKLYIGEPVEGREWGLNKFVPNAQIDNLFLATNDNGPFGNLVLDLAIDGTYQNLNLTVPANNIYKDSGTLSYLVDAGEIVKLKWVTVPAGFAGSDWFVVMTWHATSALITRYDFFWPYIGELAPGKMLGQGFKNPVKCKLFGIYYEFQGNPALGRDVIIEVYKNGAALGTPITMTIPATSLYGYLTCSQTEFLTTDTMSFRINQEGLAYPGSDLMITALTFQTT